MRTRFWLTSLITISVALPASAQAGDIQYFPWPLQFNGSPGERNDVVSTLTPDGLRITDRGAPIHPQRCTAVDPNTVQCPDQGYFHAITGDGDDTVSGDVYIAEGGDGNDHLSGNGRTSLSGGEGDDVLVGSPESEDGLSGGPGNDQLDAGAGDDRLNGGPGIDVVDGGPGRDLLELYEYRAPAARVDLALHRTPDGDVLTSIEGAISGDEDDTLLGDDGPNYFDGREGRNRIDGRGGDDELFGSGTLIGGRGNDTLHAPAGSDARCGPGRDRVTVGTRARPIVRDCELIDGAGPRVRVKGKRLSISFDRNIELPCSARASGTGFRRLDTDTLLLTARKATIRLVPYGHCARLTEAKLGRLSFRLVS